MASLAALIGSPENPKNICALRNDGLLKKGVEMNIAERSPETAHTAAERPTEESPVAPQSLYPIQRRGTRVRIRPQTPVRFQFWDAALLELSLSGALVEHTARVRPGEVYRLAVRLADRLVQMRARAARSFVNHRMPVDGGERQLVYRTGLEFVGIDPMVAQLLTTHIDRLRQHGSSGK